jgi:hypothetical protein
MLEPDRPQMTIQYGAAKMLFTCKITKAKLQTDRQTHTHTHTIFNTYCLSTSMMITQIRLYVALYEY